MPRLRSPSYPSVPLEEAIEFARKIYSKSRSNPIDREAAARDMGYTGISGRSAKVLGTLSQYGLTERTGKEGLRVSPTAVDILHPSTEAGRQRALKIAGFSPSLFAELRQRFSDGIPSENAIRSHLMRQGYGDAAITPAISSFLETCRYLQQENAFDEESSPPSTGQAQEPTKHGGTDRDEAIMAGKARLPAIYVEATPPSTLTDSLAERTIFTEEGDKGQYIKVIISGNIDEYLIDALENFLLRQKKRLGTKLS